MPSIFSEMIKWPRFFFSAPAMAPRTGRREIPCDVVLGQMVKIREDGRERRVTAAEAFLLQLAQKGIAGDSAATRASLEAIEAARDARSDAVGGIKKIITTMVASGADAIIGKLGIATRKYPAVKARMRWELSPWIIEAALERRGDQQQTRDEQREVWSAARTPHKVNWPDWWQYFGE